MAPKAGGRDSASRWLPRTVGQELDERPSIAPGQPGGLGKLGLTKRGPAPAPSRNSTKLRRPAALAGAVDAPLAGAVDAPRFHGVVWSRQPEGRGALGAVRK
jgi:hypothetical protein